jgi:predicted lipoprotein with Yx(FWY)xxD motif
MTRSRSTILALAALPLAALAVAGCGGSSNSSQSTALPKTASGKPATLGVSSTGLGTILVNSKGLTLYLFQQDKGTTSACMGACAVNWPPLRANAKLTAGSGANASLLGTAMRSDGKPQVTYHGHPVYLFTGDSKAGNTNGQGVNAFGGLWYVLSPAGNEITASTSNSGGGGGYGGY